MFFLVHFGIFFHKLKHESNQKKNFPGLVPKPEKQGKAFETA